MSKFIVSFTKITNPPQTPTKIGIFKYIRKILSRWFVVKTKTPKI